MQPKVSNNEDVQEKLRWLDGSVIPETIPTNVILKPKCDPSFSLIDDIMAVSMLHRVHLGQLLEGSLETYI